MNPFLERQSFPRASGSCNVAPRKWLGPPGPWSAVLAPQSDPCSREDLPESKFPFKTNHCNGSFRLSCLEEQIQACSVCCVISGAGMRVHGLAFAPADTALGISQ